MIVRALKISKRRAAQKGDLDETTELLTEKEDIKKFRKKVVSAFFSVYISEVTLDTETGIEDVAVDLNT